MKEKIDNWQEILDDLEAGMTQRAIAAKYGLPESTLRYRLAQVGKVKDSRFKGKVKPVKKAPKGYFVKGTSSLLDGEGNIKIQWVKTDKTAEDKYALFKKAVKSVTKRVKPIKAIKQPSHTMEDLMSIYSIGDAHIGLLAHHLETGEDHDLSIAEADLEIAMDLMVKQSLETETAFIIDVGDWFHADNAANETTHSGNKLDVDGRYAKVLDVGLRLTVRLVERALLKHKKVIWRSAIGNHNEHSAIMMSAFLKAWFRDNPRVEIADTPNMFYYHVFGKNLIGVTHGHTVKAEKLGEIMSVDCKKEWSNSEQR